MTDKPNQGSSAEQLIVELHALRQQLSNEEAEWAEWREGHAPLTKDHSEGLQELRDRIFFLEAKLARSKR